MVCAVLVFQDVPTAYFGRELDQATPEASADYASVLRVLGLAAVALGTATTMLAGVPGPPRPRGRILTAALSPLLVFALLAGLLATDGPRDGAARITWGASGAGGLALPSDPSEHTRMSWLWEHPDPFSREAFNTAVTPTGFLLMDRRGVFALNPESGRQM